MRALLVATWLVVMVASPPLALASVYDFEGLTVDQPVSGQDNWRHNDSATYGKGVVQVGSFLDHSKVATLEPDLLHANLIRGNNANFSFSLLPTETAQIVEFDYQSDGLHTGGLWQGILSLTVGSGPSGLGPGFGVSGIGPTQDMFYYRDGFFSEWGEPLPATVLPGDWLRIRTTIDFTHNDGFGGVGSLSMSYANLSAGETTFTPVASIQNIEVHDFGSPADIESLNVNLIRDNTDHNVQIDNISIGVNPTFPVILQGDVNFDGMVNIFDINLVSAHWSESGPAGDANRDGVVNIFDINLISFNWTSPGVAAPVPEPTSLTLLSLGALGVLVRGRQRLVAFVRDVAWTAR